MAKRTLKEKFKALLVAGLSQAEAMEVLHDHGDKFPTYAADVDTDDDLEVDPKPLFSEGDDGVWVQCWVHVRHPEWSCENCGETSMDGSGTCITCGTEEDQ